jgi:hypothetical protein
MTALIRIDSTWTDPDNSGAKPIRFCSRCGHPAKDPRKEPDLLRERVCRRCGMGLMLSCSRDALPGDAAAFMVVTFDLSVSAVSEVGEAIFGEEQSVIGRPLLELVTSPLGDDLLVRHVARAAQRAYAPVVLPLRLASDDPSGVGTMAARIASCGPPRAALVTVEPSEFGRR